MTFTETLTQLQEKHGETNYRLAKAIDVHQTSIKSWKTGERKPHPRHVTALERHYGLRQGTLLSLLKNSGKEVEG